MWQRLAYRRQTESTHKNTLKLIVILNGDTEKIIYSRSSFLRLGRGETKEMHNSPSLTATHRIALHWIGCQIVWILQRSFFFGHQKLLRKLPTFHNFIYKSFELKHFVVWFNGKFQHSKFGMNSFEWQHFYEHVRWVCVNVCVSIVYLAAARDWRVYCKATLDSCVYYLNETSLKISTNRNELCLTLIRFAASKTVSTAQRSQRHIYHSFILIKL